KSQMLPTDLQFRGYRLMITETDGEVVLPPVSEIKEINPLFNPIVWSLDGMEAAQIGKANYGAKVAKQVFRIKLAGRSIEAVTGDDLEPTEVLWSTSNQLCVRAASRTMESIAGDRPTNRGNWWKVEARGQYHNLAAAPNLSPDILLRESSGTSFIGVAGGDLWRIWLDGSAPTNLTEHFQPEIVSIIRPASYPPSSEIEKQPIITALSGNASEFFKIDLTSGQIQPQAKPSPNATLNVYGFSSGVAIFKLDDQTGTYLWSAQPNKPGFNKVAEINTFTRYIATAEAKKIEYRGLDGKVLMGWLLLPLHYIPGKRYPLITWAYAGSMLGDKSPKLFNIGSHIGDYPMCLQLLAARGYAVLYPSMPLEPIEKASDPYLELTK